MKPKSQAGHPKGWPAALPWVCLLGGLLLGAGSVWLWQTRNQAAPDSAEPSQAAPARQILYYRNPMGQPDTSPVPKKDEMGMDYLPVYADEAPASAAPTPGAHRQILYYRNPMGQPDISPVPKKDEMGMDYLPVYADEAQTGGLALSPERIQQLGVLSSPVRQEPLYREIRATGRLSLDERRQQTVTAKYAGWVEQLPVNSTGQTVRAGQTLLETYSPELIAAQQEYLIARDSQHKLGLTRQVDGGRRLSLEEGALQRLRYWDLPETSLQRLVQSRQVRRTLPLPSPISGVVLEKKVIQGSYFQAGDALFELADLRQLWLLVEVFETDLAGLQAGESAEIRLDAYPGESLTGRLDFIYPTLNPQTRTVSVRILLDNPEGRFKPGMLANASLTLPLPGEPPLSVPESALIDSGSRQSLLIAQGNGRFEPRAVVAGPVAVTALGERRVVIKEGLLPNEQVVTRANFLLDSESNLRAAFGSLQPAASPAKEG